MKTIWSRAEDAGKFESEHREKFDVDGAQLQICVCYQSFAFRS